MAELTNDLNQDLAIRDCGNNSCRFKVGVRD